ncbi:flagellin [Marinospirillum sp.]|uniref:flagellin n=1 Tax=Marinospirillum sp. TaxID=2183934 RepID=UPI003850E5D3
MSLDSNPELTSTIIQSVTGNRDHQNSIRSPFKQKEETSILQRLASGLRDSSRPSPVDFHGKDGFQQNIRSLGAARRNMGDGLSMLHKADSGLDQIQKNLERLGQLAETASDPRYSQKDRESLQKEANSLLQDIQRITETTDYKGQQLLSQDAASTSFQVGPHSQEISRLSLGFEQGILGRLESSTTSSSSSSSTNTSSSSSDTSSTNESSTDTSSGTTETNTSTTDADDDSSTDTTTSPNEDTDTSAGDTSTGDTSTGDTGNGTTSGDTQTVTSVSEITTNEEIAATFGWEVNDNGELVVGAETAEAMSSFWNQMIEKQGKNITPTDELASRLDLEGATVGETNHQYISETFDINGKQVEYSFKVSFDVTTNEDGERVLASVDSTYSHKDEWRNGSPVNVTLGDEQLAVTFNRNGKDQKNQGYNYLEEPTPKGNFQNFGIYTPDYTSLNVENVEQTASPNPDTTTEPTDGGTSGGDTESSQDETSDTGSSTDTTDSGETTTDNGSNTGSGTDTTNGDTTTSGTEDNLLKNILTSDLTASQPVQLSSSEAAQNLVQKTREATDFIQGMRNDLEAGISKLGSIMAGNGTYSQALEQGSQRIENSVSAQEVAAKAQEQLLNQTSTAAMGMANTTDKAVLALLKDPEASTKEIPYSFAAKEEKEEKPEQEPKASEKTSEFVTAFASKEDKEDSPFVANESEEEDAEDEQPLYQYPPEEEEAANNFFSNFTASNMTAYEPSVQQA